MFAVLDSDVLLSLDPRERAQVLDGQQKRAMDAFFSSGQRLPNENLPELAELVFEHTYVRIKPGHLRRILNLYPYTERMLAKYGFVESVLQELFNCVSVVLVATEFVDTHEFKDILERQAYNLFNRMDEHDERVGNVQMQALNKLPMAKPYDAFAAQAERKASLPFRASPRTRLQDSCTGPFYDMKENGE
jgi:hypothetical protein